MNSFMQALLIEKAKVSKAHLSYDKDGIKANTHVEGSGIDICVGMITLLETAVKNMHPDDKPAQIEAVDDICDYTKQCILNMDSENVSV